jgi:hypothetical protein
MKCAKCGADAPQPEGGEHELGKTGGYVAITRFQLSEWKAMAERGLNSAIIDDLIAAMKKPSFMNEESS